MTGIFDWFREQSLARQFLLAGGLVSLAAAAILGFLVTRQIEKTVIQSTATNTAMYVDSVIAPLLPDMQKKQPLDASVIQALDEVLSQGTLGERLVSFKLWSRDGTILYAKDKSLIGKSFELGDDLTAAWAGKVAASFDGLGDVESEAERARGQPLLEIYNPVLQPWSGEVVAVSEFYEVATDFEKSLGYARLWSWLAVLGGTAAFFALLSAVVLRGSKTIDAQKHALVERVDELSQLVSQNRQLHQRVQRASQRTAALNESYLRRIGADLHDGPAQLIALASLRLDSKAVTDSKTPKAVRLQELQNIRSGLDDAMIEIRSICNGLVLPHIEALELEDILRLAIAEHKHRTDKSVTLSVQDRDRPLSTSEKICVYRFVQEALNNAYRHAGESSYSVTQHPDRQHLIIEVADDGQGFEVAAVRPEGLGLAGMRERIESLGGSFHIVSSAAGTTVTLKLNSGEPGPS